MAEVQHLRSGRRLEAAVTDYSQRWTVRTAPGGDRVVRAVMRVVMAITSGEHTYGFKSLVDRAHEKSVSGVRVTDDDTGEVLRHELSEKNGYVFVKWWYTEPLTQNGVASTVIEYDLHDAVSGCSLPDQPPEAAGSWYDTADFCEERFEAPWANYWKIPVEGMPYYTFAAVPSNETGQDIVPVRGSLFLQEPSPSREYTLKEADGTVELSQRFTPAELGIGSRNPANVAFRWYVSDPNGAIAHCRQVCSSEDINPLIWLTLIVPGLAIVGGLVVCCKRRSRRKQQLDGNDSRLGAEAEAPAARPLPKATAYDAAYDSSMPTAESAVAVRETATPEGLPPPTAPSISMF